MWRIDGVLNQRATKVSILNRLIAPNTVPCGLVFAMLSQNEAPMLPISSHIPRVLRGLVLLGITCGPGMAQELPPIEVTDTWHRVLSRSETVLHFAFAAGDVVLLSIEPLRGRLDLVEWREYDGPVRYSQRQVDLVEQKAFPVAQTAVYQLTLQTRGLRPRDVRVHIARIPEGRNTLHFNTAVEWHTCRDTTYTYSEVPEIAAVHWRMVSVINPELYHLRSGLGQILGGGKPRMAVHGQLPKGTVEWYYALAAFANRTEAMLLRGGVDLRSQLERALRDPNTRFTENGQPELPRNLLRVPAGSATCNVQVLEGTQALRRLAGKRATARADASRTNTSGVVTRVPSAPQPDVVIAVSNASNFQGVHLWLEAVALVREEEWTTRTVAVPQVSERSVPKPAAR
jgi:hypothetical protein